MVVVIWQRAPSQVWAGLRFSLSERWCGVLQGCLHKKSYYVSHIQVWTLSDGQSSLWSCRASKASPTFSKKSVIHAVVNVFSSSFFFFWSCFCLHYNCWLCWWLLGTLRTEACSTLHTPHFFTINTWAGENPLSADRAASFLTKKKIETINKIQKRDLSLDAFSWSNNTN